MYCSAAEVWNGLAKNATEGLGTPALIVPITLLLLIGQVLPLALLLIAIIQVLPLLRLRLHHAFIVGVSEPLLLAAFLAALLLSYLPRLIASRKFKQPMTSALFHPVGVLVLLTLQWYAMVRQMIGKPVGWRARKYSSRTGEQVR